MNTIKDIIVDQVISSITEDIEKEIIQQIKKLYLPEQIFPVEDLHVWAISNGYSL